MGITDFSGSASYISRWKNRYGITSKTTHGEAASSADVTDWKEVKLPALLDRWKPYEIWNCDETALFYKLLPDKTLAFETEKVRGVKKARERITILLFFNADGTKRLAPIIVGRWKQPARQFKNHGGLAALQSQCTYYYAGKGWINREIFKQVLLKWNSALRRKNQKVCLTMDNCAAHHKLWGDDEAEFSHIHIVYFPANTTALLQPLDQGIIRALKCRYRAEIAKRYLIHLEDNQPPADFQKKVDLRTCVDLLAYHWKKVPDLLIENCFRHVGFGEERTFGGYVEKSCHVMDNDVWGKLQDKGIVTVSFDEYVDIEDKLQVQESAPLTDAQIVQMTKEDSETDDGATTDEEGVVEPERVNPISSVSAALVAIADLKDFAKGKGVDVKCLQDFEQELIVSRCKGLKQAPLSQFIRKDRDSLAVRAMWNASRTRIDSNVTEVSDSDALNLAWESGSESSDVFEEPKSPASVIQNVSDD